MRPKNRPSLIELELRRATGLEREDTDLNSTRYRKKLAETADGMGDSDWEKLSPITKRWLNDAIEALRLCMRVPNFYDVGQKDKRIHNRQAGRRVLEVLLDRGFNTPAKEVRAILLENDMEMTLSSVALHVSMYRKCVSVLQEYDLLVKPLYLKRVTKLRRRRQSK